MPIGGAGVSLFAGLSGGADAWRLDLHRRRRVAAAAGARDRSRAARDPSRAGGRKGECHRGPVRRPESRRDPPVVGGELPHAGDALSDAELAAVAGGRDRPERRRGRNRGPGLQSCRCGRRAGVRLAGRPIRHKRHASARLCGAGGRLAAAGGLGRRRGDPVVRGGLRLLHAGHAICALRPPAGHLPGRRARHRRRRGRRGGPARFDRRSHARGNGATGRSLAGGGPSPARAGGGHGRRGRAAARPHDVASSRGANMEIQLERDWNQCAPDRRQRRGMRHD